MFIGIDIISLQGQVQSLELFSHYSSLALYMGQNIGKYQISRGYEEGTESKVRTDTQIGGFCQCSIAGVFLRPA